MNKVTMLFVRACKTANYNEKRTTDARLRSVYRRFYLYDPDNIKIALINVLSTIVENYKLLTVTALVTKLDPNYVFSRDEEYDYIDRCLVVMVNAIRYAEASKFPEIISPLMFRKK